METIQGHPSWSLTFDQHGKLTGTTADAFLAELSAAKVDNLFVMSHGWGTSSDGAKHLYEGKPGDASQPGMFPLIADAADGRTSLGVIGFVGIYWPSLWFPDPPDHDGAVAAAVEAGQPGAADAALTGGQIATSLAPSFGGTDAATVHKLGALIDAGTAGVAAGEPADKQQARVDEFHGLLQKLVTTAPAQPEDSGETKLLQSSDPTAAYQALSDGVGSAPPAGAAEGIGDIFGKVWNGAKDALRVGSYYEMKSRAGSVGQKGLGPLLVKLHTASPGTRVHLIGHSFGARLVAFSLNGIPTAEQSPVGSLCLVQGAFSHWSFGGAQGNPFGFAGKLHGINDRVHGPLAATFTPYDWAVGKWYPKASLLAREDDEAESNALDRWGGMGSDGFQAVTPKGDISLLEAGKPYEMVAGTFYRTDSSSVISDVKQSSFAGAHSDIQHPEVAWLVVSAAEAGGA